MIKNATFVSVWDDDTEIESYCKVNMETREVFDIETVDVSDMDLDAVTSEYVIIENTEYDVSYIDYMSVDDLDDAEFWYN